MCIFLWSMVRWGGGYGVDHGPWTIEFQRNVYISMVHGLWSAGGGWVRRGSRIMDHRILEKCVYFYGPWSVVRWGGGGRSGSRTMDHRILGKCAYFYGPWSAGGVGVRSRSRTMDHRILKKCVYFYGPWSVVRWGGWYGVDHGPWTIEF